MHREALYLSSQVIKQYNTKFQSFFLSFEFLKKWNLI